MHTKDIWYLQYLDNGSSSIYRLEMYLKYFRCDKEGIALFTLV